MRYIASTVVRTCPICGRKFKTNSPVRRYCGSAQCEAKRLVEKNYRRRNRRHRLAARGIKLHGAGNT